ncbi:DinB family protein [Alteribacter aurantiacus]|uniref:DinB family protein n=1 Tax=Alteribacter aurantiacus TaxID=254410 RepID=UPI000422455E|nr:DinB family protein [Alteribacter aurantiacus]
MNGFFEYNWQVRDEWFAWCEALTEDEITEERVGGQGTILRTLFHVIDVEYSWIRAVAGKDDVAVSFERVDSLEKVQQLSTTYREEIRAFLYANPDIWDRIGVVKPPWLEISFSFYEVGHHVVAHEIHHMGQLSIWSREMGRRPISANAIGRGLLRG